jgi:hypothetical protein
VTRALVVLVAIAGCVPASAPPPAAPAAAAGIGEAAPTGVVVNHAPSRDLPDLARAFADSGVLHAAADLINRAFVLEHRIRLVAADCGRANAYYDPHNRTVTICHELVALIAQTFPGDRYLRHLYLYVTMHELGHALIDVLDLPVVGREEDAADQFAALFFVDVADRDLGAVMGVLLAAQFVRRTPVDRTAYWDNHAFGEARYYQLLCLIYGGAAATRDVLAPVLPPERAAQCTGEYGQVRRGWNRLLAPYRADGGDLFRR